MTELGSARGGSCALVLAGGCPRCGDPILVPDIFCGGCGLGLDQAEPTTGSAAASGAKSSASARPAAFDFSDKEE